MRTSSLNITEIDVSNNINLITLNLQTNANLTSIIGLSNCVDLQNLYIMTSGVTGTLDVSGNTNLTILQAYDCPNLTSIDASGAALTQLRAENCQSLTSIDASGTALTYLRAANCPLLSSVDLTGCTGFNNPTTDTLYLYDNPMLTSLDISMTSFLHSSSRLQIQNCNMTSLIVPATGSTLAQWQGTPASSNNTTFHLTGNNFGSGNVGITQAP